MGRGRVAWTNIEGADRPRNDALRAGQTSLVVTTSARSSPTTGVRGRRCAPRPGRGGPGAGVQHVQTRLYGRTGPGSPGRSRRSGPRGDSGSSPGLTMYERGLQADDELGDLQDQCGRGDHRLCVYLVHANYASAQRGLVVLRQGEVLERALPTPSRASRVLPCQRDVTPALSARGRCYRRSYGQANSAISTSRTRGNAMARSGSATARSRMPWRISM